MQLRIVKQDAGLKTDNNMQNSINRALSCKTETMLHASYITFLVGARIWL